MEWEAAIRAFHLLVGSHLFRNPMDIKISRQDLTKLLILIINAALITNLQAPVFALTEGPAEVAKQGASLAYAFRPTDMSKTTIWVTIEIAKTRSVLHTVGKHASSSHGPLIGVYQPRVPKLRLRDAQLLP